MSRCSSAVEWKKINKNNLKILGLNPSLGKFIKVHLEREFSFALDRMMAFCRLSTSDAIDQAAYLQSAFFVSSWKSTNMKITQHQSHFNDTSVLTKFKEWIIKECVVVNTSICSHCWTVLFAASFPESSLQI